MAINKVIYGNDTLIDITDTTATESDVKQGVVFYKADGTRSVGTMAGSSSFVGMVVQGTNLITEADVKAIYGSDTSWTLLSSVALASEHVFGNGYAFALTNGSVLGSTRASSGSTLSTNGYGTNVGTVTASANIGSPDTKSTGSPTKIQLGANPEYSGLIADTITIYTWERTV